MNKIFIEIFRARIRDEKVLYTKHLVDIEPSDQRDPDDIVQEELQKHMHVDHIEKAITHSTSWRYEKENLHGEKVGAIILTYLVYSDFMELSSNEHYQIKELKLSDMSIATGKSHKTPRPEVIEEEHVLSHAIRHLAFLLNNKDKDHFGHLLSQDTQKKITEYKPALATKLF
jgi:hypothetical protein